MEATDEARNTNFLKAGRLWLIASGIAVVILVTIGIVHVCQVHKAKNAASNIKVGDKRDQVVKLLGHPGVSFSTGFPPQGGAATIYGSCYGGFLTKFQHPENWPVVIIFDKDGTVVEVKK
jgi:hypothetical protein